MENLKLKKIENFQKLSGEENTAQNYLKIGSTILTKCFIADKGLIF